MLDYFIKRVLSVIPTLLIVIVLAFLFMHLLPDDPARLAAGPEADETTADLIRKDLGLDKPMYGQFVHFFTNAARDEFGNFICAKCPVSEEIGERFRPMFNLTITSMVWAVVFDIVIDITSTVWRSKWPDRLGMTLAVSGISFPAFAPGMLLMEVFLVQLGWLPSIGADSWEHYILSSLTLGVAVTVVTVRFIRASFVEVLQEDSVRTARAKDARETVVVIRHCLRNVAIPMVTTMSLQFDLLLGGSIVVEKVFNWPGSGRLLVDAVEVCGYPVVQVEVLLFSLELILINLVVGMLYTVINPTIRYKK